MKKYWLIVVSKDHIARGIAGSFVQANHGKATSLKRMTKGDGVLIYSPKVNYSGNQKLQAFTAIGEVTGDEVYQHKMTDDFTPYRRDVKYQPAHDVPIAPMIDELDFIEDKKAWGYLFRFGFFEVPVNDFMRIKSKMTI